MIENGNLYFYALPNPCPCLIFLKMKFLMNLYGKIILKNTHTIPVCKEGLHVCKGGEVRVNKMCLYDCYA